MRMRILALCALLPAVATAGINNPTAASGGAFTRVAVTTTEDLGDNGSGNIYAGIATIGGNYAITLPSAAAASGRVVKVADEIGTADSAGLVTIVRAGSDTIRLPLGGAITPTVTTLLLARSGGSVELVSDGTSEWAVTARAGVAVDPRAITGLYAWWEFSRGGTQDTGGFSALTDQSGNGHDLAQSTSGVRPDLATGRRGRAVAYFSEPNATQDSMVTDGTQDMSSGELTVMMTVQRDWVESGGQTGGSGIYMAPTATANWAFDPVASNAIDYTTRDMVCYGDGWNSGRSPRAYIRRLRDRGQAITTLGCALSSSVAKLWVDGLIPYTIGNATTNPVTTITNTVITLSCGRGFCYGVQVYTAALSDTNLALLADYHEQAYK